MEDSYGIRPKQSFRGGRTSVALVGSAAVVAIAVSCQTLSTNAPLAVTKASASNAALRHVWTIDDSSEIQSFLRGSQATNTWKLEAPISSSEDSARNDSTFHSSVTAISWTDGSVFRERAYYVNAQGALRAIAYDGTTRRYITDTMAAIPGVSLTGSLSSVVYLGNRPVIVGVGIPSGSTRHLYSFTAAAGAETSYSAQDLGSPGVNLAFGNDVVARATDGLSYCAFAITAAPPSNVGAIGTGGWVSSAIPGTSGEVAASSVTAVRWTGSDNVPHYSSFVKSNTGNVWEAIWDVGCTAAPTWRNLGAPPGAATVATLSAAIDPSNNVMHVLASGGAGVPYVKTYTAGSAPPSSWSVAALVFDTTGAAGRVLVDPITPSTFYFLGRVGASGTAHLYENSASDLSPGSPASAVSLSDGDFASEPWTESHYSESKGHGVLAAMVTNSATNDTRVAVGTTDSDGDAWTTALVPLILNPPSGGSVIQGDPTTLIEPNGNQLVMFHEIPVSTCGSGSLTSGAHRIRLLNVTTTTNSSGNPQLGLSAAPTPGYFSSDGDQRFLDHPWMVATSDGTEHFAWFEEDRVNEAAGRMAYATRTNGTFSASLQLFAQQTSGFTPGPPFMAVSGGTSLYVAWHPDPFAGGFTKMLVCKWPACTSGATGIVDIANKAGTCVTRNDLIRQSPIAFAGTTTPNTIYAAFSADKATIPSQTATSCPNAFPSCPNTAQSEIVFTQSTDGGQTWSCARRVGATAPPSGVNQMAPTLAVQAGTNAFITYLEQNGSGSAVLGQKLAIRSGTGAWFRATRQNLIDTTLLPLRCNDSGPWMGDYRVAVGAFDHVHAMHVDVSTSLTHNAIMTVSALSSNEWR